MRLSAASLNYLALVRCIRKSLLDYDDFVWKSAIVSIANNSIEIRSCELFSTDLVEIMYKRESR